MARTEPAPINVTTHAVAFARAAVVAAGYTPCDASAWHNDRFAFAFSVASAGGCSATGPAFEVRVEIATGAVW